MWGKVFVSAGMYAILEWLMKKAHFHDIENSHFIPFCQSVSFISYRKADDLARSVEVGAQWRAERNGLRLMQVYVCSSSTLLS